MPTIPDLVLDKQYDDLQVLTEANLDAAYNSIVDYVNNLKDDFLSVTKDALGSDYTYPTNGDPAFTNTVFEKQVGVVNYNSGALSLGTVVTPFFNAVDAVNAAITFTPERPGAYRAVFIFPHSFSLNVTSEGGCETSFRITDGTTVSGAISSGGFFPATVGVGTFVRLVTPITISVVFNWADTSTRIISLQKLVSFATNVQFNYVAESPVIGALYMTVEKI